MNYPNAAILGFDGLNERNSPRVHVPLVDCPADMRSHATRRLTRFPLFRLKIPKFKILSLSMT
jgi:hypothetical protein